MASLHLLAEYFDVDLIKKWWRELVLLSKEPYFLPTLVVCVGVAVAITYFQDNKHVAHGAAIEESEDALDADDIPSSPSTATKEKSGNHSNGDKTSGAKKPFALPSTPLPPPKDDPIAAQELAQYDGSDATKPIYVAIKGIVFDVSSKRETYAPGGGYHVFAGKDASKALGKSSLKPEDCVADYSSLDEKEMETLNNWVTFFEKRYPIVGKVVN